MPAISKKRREQMDAHEQLVLQLMDYPPAAIPCRGPRSGAWQSSNSTLAEYAAKECWRCPIVDQCRAYALEHEKDRSETWGGLRPRVDRRRSALATGGR